METRQSKTMFLFAGIAAKWNAWSGSLRGRPPPTFGLPVAETQWFYLFCCHATRSSLCFIMQKHPGLSCASFDSAAGTINWLAILGCTLNVLNHANQNHDMVVEQASVCRSIFGRTKKAKSSESVKSYRRILGLYVSSSYFLYSFNLFWLCIDDYRCI